MLETVQFNPPQLCMDHECDGWLGSTAQSLVLWAIVQLGLHTRFFVGRVYRRQSPL